MRRFAPHEFRFIGSDRIGSDRIGSDWIGLDWIGLIALMRLCELAL
jgi:hypothetical protein